MNATINWSLILIGLGLGFFIASCLMFYIVHVACRQAVREKSATAKVNEQMLAQQRQIMFATARVADALQQIAKQGEPQVVTQTIRKLELDDFTKAQPGLDA